MNRINEELLREIDAVTLYDRLQAWRKAVRAAPWKLYADREKYTVSSWRETEGEDIQLRRAKLVKNVLDNIDIAILEYDVIAGRPTPGVIGACTSIDVCGDYIPDLWDNKDTINLTMNADAGIDAESLAVLRESARLFSGTTAPEMTAKAWEAAYGSWAKDATDAKLKDPTIDIGIFGQVTSVLMWDKILTKGLRSFIEEAQGHIRAFHARRDTDASKLQFWQSAVIVLEAVINHARRYAALARDMAKSEKDPARRAELLAMAEACDHVPEYPARSFHEALQAMAIVNVCKLLSTPCTTTPSGGAATNTYIRFQARYRRWVLTPAQAGDFLAELMAVGTQIFATTNRSGVPLLNLALTTSCWAALTEGKDASNELSYLFLHMVGLLQLSSPTVGIRWNK